MKIIQVTSKYLPAIGGIAKCSSEITQRLADRGYDIEVITSDIELNDQKKLQSTKKISIIYCKSFGFNLFHSPISPSLPFKLWKIPKDSIVHLHVGHPLFPDMASLVCRIRKIPYIAHYHSENEPAGKFGFLLPFYKKIFLKKILKSANLVLVPTEDYVNIVKNNYDVSESKIRIVPNGVDNRLFKKTSHKIHNPVRILFVGRFAKEKNLSILIKAFKIVSLWNKNVILHLVGDGEEKDNILKVIKDEQVTDKIKFHGRLEGKKLYEIYSNSDIFVLTSKRESFGIVILEAMASGLPIVAPKIAAIRNVVTDGEDGILYKNTPKSLAEKIKELISSNEIREKLSNNALKKASKYDWERIVNQIENIYEEISNETKHK